LKKLPFALNTLPTFTAAAQCLSFKAAAEQLHLSPSAVSRQIQSLEASLDTQLFVRNNRSLQLTAAGRILLNSAQSSFELLSAAVTDISKDSTVHRLRLSVLPYFANNWLLPRLAQFTALNPEVQLSFDSESTYKRFDADVTDGCFRFAPELRDDLETLKLFRQYAVPVASPKLLERHGWSGDLAALNDMRWFDAAAQPDLWQQWQRIYQCESLTAKDRLSFDDAETALQAARESLGVVMGAWPLIERDIQQQRLVCLTEPHPALSETYYFVYSRNSRQPSLLAMVEWLRQFQAQD